MGVQMICTKCERVFVSKTVDIGSGSIPKLQNCPVCDGDTMQLTKGDEVFETWNYPLEMVNGHMIVDVDERKYLIDTGSGECINETLDPFLNFGGKKWHAVQKFNGRLLRDIRKFIGSDIDGIVGTNALSCLSWMARIDEGIFTAHSKIPDEWQDTLAWLRCEASAIPILRVKHNGEEYKAVIDTGAKVCYAKREIWDRVMGSIINTDDFYPTPKGVEVFDVPLKTMEIGFKDAVARGESEGFIKVPLQRTHLPVGILPEHMEALLHSFGADFILGPELLQDIRIGFSMQRKLAYFIPKEGA